MGLKSKYNKEADIFILGNYKVEIKLIGGIFEGEVQGEYTIIELDLKNNTRRKLKVKTEDLKELNEVWTENRILRENKGKIKHERAKARAENKNKNGLLSDVIIEGVTEAVTKSVVEKLKSEFGMGSISVGYTNDIVKLHKESEQESVDVSYDYTLADDFMAKYGDNLLFKCPDTDEFIKGTFRGVYNSTVLLSTKSGKSYRIPLSGTFKKIGEK